MPITIYPGSMKKRNANGSYSDLVPAIGTDPEVLDDFAEEYDPTATYNIGDYCIHNSDFYKCNTNNTTGTWNNNAWDRVTVGDELADHKNTLNQLDDDVNALEISTLDLQTALPKLDYSTTISNLNDVSLVGGCYYYGSNTTGAPETTAGRLLQIKASASSWGGQIAVPNSNQTCFYVRMLTSSGYKSWERLKVGSGEVSLWSGTNPTTDGSTQYTLSQAYTNFTTLRITFIANAEHVYTYVPVKDINTSSWFDGFFASSENTGLKSSFEYMGRASVRFVSTTKFVALATWTNNNITLKPREIVGIY